MIKKTKMSYFYYKDISILKRKINKYWEGFLESGIN